MFGISAFAQAPFASLGTLAFSFSITENIGMADSSTQQSAFLQSTTQNIIVDDVDNDAGINYFGSATETIAFDDSSTQLSTFLQTIAEDFSPASHAGSHPEPAAKAATRLRIKTWLSGLADWQSQVALKPATTTTSAVSSAAGVSQLLV